MENTIHYIDYYLDLYGEAIAKEEFDQNLIEGWNTAYVLYVGGGFQPLGVAVLTFGQDVSSCYTRFEEWCRDNDRLYEIGEEDVEDEFFGEYESFHKPYKLSENTNKEENVDAITGSVSWGTLREEDLISAFTDVLEELAPDKAKEIEDEHQDVEDAWRLEALFDALSELAPEGHYFGAHVGDGSDFGFWPVEFLD